MGVIVSFGVIVLALYYFITNLYALIVNPSVENAVVPIIPGVTINFTEFAYLILPIFFIFTVHEFSHAISFRNRWDKR